MRAGSRFPVCRQPVSGLKSFGPYAFRLWNLFIFVDLNIYTSASVDGYCGESTIFELSLETIVGQGHCVSEHVLWKSIGEVKKHFCENQSQIWGILLSKMFHENQWRGGENAALRRLPQMCALGLKGRDLLPLCICTICTICTTRKTAIKIIDLRLRGWWMFLSMVERSISLKTRWNPPIWDWG